MKIVVVGAGAVGAYLAERLALEGQDVHVVESDPERAAELQNSVDCLVVTGNGASGAVLEEAGIKGADLMIAVTSSDAVNILACHAAARLGVPRKVARIEDPALRDETKHLGVDFVIDPGIALARELLLLVRQGGVSELVEFANGRLDLIGGYVPEEAPLTGQTLAELRAGVDEWHYLVTAVIRNGDTTIARGDTIIEEGDHVLVVSKAEHAAEVRELLGITERAAEKVMILGGTRLAQMTAGVFARSGISTVLIDEDPERCRIIAQRVPKAVCVCGDPTDPRILRSEGIENVDVVLALTGWDEINILGSVVAKALGVPTAVARLHRFDLVGMLTGVGIDAGVSSRLAAANEILRFVRRGLIHSVATFPDSNAEALELQVAPGSKSIGRSLLDIKLTRGAIVAGILRGDEAFLPHGDTVIAAGDRLTVVTLPEAITEVEKTFS